MKKEVAKMRSKGVRSILVDATHNVVTETQRRVPYTKSLGLGLAWKMLLVGARSRRLSQQERI